MPVEALVNLMPFLNAINETPPLFFRSLKCDRLRVHRNFMLALIIRYIVSCIYYEPFIYGESEPKVWFKDIGQVLFLELISFRMAARSNSITHV